MLSQTCHSGKAFAHSANELGNPHYLDEHLKAVAHLAATLIPDKTYEQLAHYIGLWHDLGKYNPRWQAKLQALAGQNRGRIGIPHAGQGALLAFKHSIPASFCIYGHHAGLPNWSDFRLWLTNPDTTDERTALYTEAIAQATVDFPEGLQPQHKLKEPENWEHWDVIVRLLFSALIDADYTDTALHFAASCAPSFSYPSTSELLEEFETKRTLLINKNNSNSTIDQIRSDIYEHCKRAADLPKGLFKLAAPTGGGKTLSLMGFGLHHAVTHKLERVIYTAPFTSIIDQTADVYRSVLSESVVLEHHSAVTEDKQATDDMGMRRLAAQNWNFPIVVTTTVQLLESLFSNRPSRCRKLHNIANSVIVLDEVQALPTKYLTPILRMLQSLIDYCGCTVVLCTATQPAYRYIKGYDRVATEIIPQETLSFHFNSLKRVEYRNCTQQQWTWEQVISDIKQRSLSQVLIVCNTTAEAQSGLAALLQVFAQADCFHLSTRMYGAHRRRVLEQVNHKLQSNQQIFLISTQLIEAGVDLDFADGYRMIAPLDSIVQTAGRVNRQGRNQNLGTLTVFRLQGEKFPTIDYGNAARDSRLLLDQGYDLNSPRIFEDYFRRRHRNQNSDQKQIQELRERREFKLVSENFKLIDEETTSIFIAHEPKAKEILEELQSQRFLSSGDYRRIQPYLVNLRESFLKQRSQDIREVKHKLLIWDGTYDPKCGIV
jgi:CRISPR-associated endonuclease/helicase Cas3